MGTHLEAAGLGSERLAADRGWVRWGVAAAVTGMLAWVVGVALIPLDAKLDQGDQHLALVLRAHTGQLYAAALLAVLGAVLLVVFCRAHPPGSSGVFRLGLLRVSLPRDAPHAHRSRHLRAQLTSDGSQTLRRSHVRPCGQG